MVHVRRTRNDVEDGTQRLRLKLLAVRKAQLIAHHADPVDITWSVLFY